MVGITESWASEEVDGAELGISGYVLFRKDRPSAIERRGGGVLLYVREELTPVEFHPRTEYPEHIWCRLGDDKGKGLLVGVCYRTGSQIFDYDLSARIREMLTELRDDRVLLMGDFNYPGVDWRGDCRGPSLESVMFAECLEDNFYEQYVKEPTRGGNILDLVITNEQGLIGEVSVEAGLAASDHGMVRWSIYIGSDRKKDNREIMDYRRGDLEGMRRELRGADWGSIIIHCTQIVSPLHYMPKCKFIQMGLISSTHPHSYLVLYLSILCKHIMSRVNNCLLPRCSKNIGGFPFMC